MRLGPLVFFKEISFRKFRSAADNDLFALSLELSSELTILRRDLIFFFSQVGFLKQRKNGETILRMICFLVYIIRTLTSIPEK
jgi:hypothetical protein